MGRLMITSQSLRNFMQNIKIDGILTLIAFEIEGTFGGNHKWPKKPTIQDSTDV